MRRLKLFIVNTVILIITSFFIRTISMFFEIYIANKIGSEGIGLFNLIMSVYLFAITIANSGIGLASTRIVAEEMALDRKHGAKIAISKCISYSVVFGIVASILLTMLAPFVCKNLLHGKINEIVLYIIAVSLPFSAVTSAINGYFVGVKKISRNSAYEVINLIVKIITIFILINYISPKNIEISCVVLVIANTISEIMSFVVIYILYRIDKRRIGEKRVIQENYLKRVLRISIPVAITSYLRSGLSTVKHMLIPLRLEKHGMTCDNALATYGMINGMALPLLLFPGLIINSVSSLLIPEFARYNTKSDYKRMNEVINTTFCLCLFFSVVIAIIYIVFHKELANFTYGNIEIANYLLILAPLMIFMYLDHIVDAMLKGVDGQVGVMYCNIIDLFMSIALIYTLVPVYGVNGYIFILYFSEIFNFSISLYQLKKITQFSFDLKIGLKSIFKIKKH